MNIKRIPIPKYRVGRLSLNEYELRRLMFDVCLGIKQPGIEVKDQNGKTAIIQENGSLDCNLFGLDINSMFALGMLRHRREKAAQETTLEK